MRFLKVVFVESPEISQIHTKRFDEFFLNVFLPICKSRLVWNSHTGFSPIFPHRFDEFFLR